MANFAEFPFRDCLENSWTGRIARFLGAQSVEKEAFHPVPRARGITKWSLFRVSRQSLEEEFYEVHSVGASRIAVIIGREWWQGDLRRRDPRLHLDLAGALLHGQARV